MRLSGQGTGRGTGRTALRYAHGLCGVVPVVAILSVAAGPDAASLYPALLPTPEIPTLPTAILLGALAALLPAVITPPAATAVEVAA